MAQASRATTIRFSGDVYTRLDSAAVTTGLPINSIVIAACIDWLDAHASQGWADLSPMQVPRPARLAQIGRAIKTLATRGGGMYPFERFTESAKRALILAQEEAEAANHAYLGTEHLLLGLIRDLDGPALRVLANLGLTPGDVRTEIDSMLGRRGRKRSTVVVPTSRVKKVIEIAFREASRMGDNHVGPGHLLLAVVIEQEGIAGRVLENLGVTREKVSAELHREGEDRPQVEGQDKPARVTRRPTRKQPGSASVPRRPAVRKPPRDPAS